MKIPILWRRRLERAPKADIQRPVVNLRRYKDPKTGRVYVGLDRYDPFLVESCINQFDGLTVQTESDYDE